MDRNSFVQNGAQKYNGGGRPALFAWPSTPQGALVLRLELTGGMFGCYAPPYRSPRWLERFAFMEKAGARWWPIAGGIYVVRAKKRVHGMRLVTPAWRQERARRRALAPIPQRSAGNG